MAIMGKFKNYLNCHNSNCTQDRRNFGSRVWFGDGQFNAVI